MPNRQKIDLGGVLSKGETILKSACTLKTKRENLEEREPCVQNH